MEGQNESSAINGKKILDGTKGSVRSIQYSPFCPPYFSSFDNFQTLNSKNFIISQI